MGVGKDALYSPTTVVIDELSIVLDGGNHVEVLLVVLTRNVRCRRARVVASPRTCMQDRVIPSQEACAAAFFVVVGRDISCCFILSHTW